jgi:hypothetical protein
MNTNRLILKNGFLTLLVILSLSLNGFASAEANEIIASSGIIRANETKDLTVLATGSKEDITETLKSWMESGLYWASIGIGETENTEISDEMLQTKLQDKTSFSSDAGNELLYSLKSWMQDGFYWDKMDE